MHALIQRAIRHSDELVLVFDYRDAKGAVTRRVVSPVRLIKGERLLALCLSREEPRQFYLNRCENIHLDWAANFVMPVPMVEEPAPGVVDNSALLAEPQAAA